MRVLLAVLLCGGVVQAETGPFHWRGSVAQGRAIEIRGINGDVIAEGYEGAYVEVVASVAENDGERTPVEVKAIEHAGGVTVCAVVPSAEGGTENVCPDPQKAGPAVARSGHRVDFAVKVPRGVDLIGRTVNGRVEAKQMDSDVEAYTVNGKIDISTKRSAQARSVNGSITASLGKPELTLREFTTVNGSITLNLASTAGAKLDATTVNGRVSTAFRLRNQTSAGERSVRGVVGTGSGSLGTLKLKTVNGSIELKRT